MLRPQAAKNFRLHPFSSSPLWPNRLERQVLPFPTVAGHICAADAVATSDPLPPVPAAPLPPVPAAPAPPPSPHPAVREPTGQHDGDRRAWDKHDMAQVGDVILGRQAGISSMLD